MLPRTLVRDGVRVPTFLYGTAWKEARTESCTALALSVGFTGIDTANQRRHYHEAGAGAGMRAFLAAHGRDALFVQTKFTTRGGQDHRLPYDARADVATQVEQSFESSLEHLGVQHIDSYVLHGPSSQSQLTDEDWRAWRAMEGLAGSGRARLLGISNVGRAHLEQLLAGAAVKPAFVQNRCYARRGWDRAVRAVCAENNILYQGFSLLTANPEVVGHPAVRRIAARAGCTAERVVFRFALGLGMIPLTGTTSAAHMREDLAAYDLVLEPAEMTLLEAI
jgi:diketogulonate reductase-like aldo/keto reductase